MQLLLWMAAVSLNTAGQGSVSAVTQNPPTARSKINQHV